MDYGREAYALASELERRIGGGSPSFRAASSVFTGVCPPSEVTEIAGYTGGAALIVLDVTSSGAGGCEVLLGGVKAGSVASDGTFPFVFAVSGGGAIALKPAAGVTVTGVTVGAAGTDCAFVASDAPFAADADGASVYAAENADGLRLSRFDGGGFAPLATFAEAKDFDVAAYPDGALVAACDGKGNGALFLTDGGGIVRTAPLSACLRVAAAFTGGGFTVAAYDGRKVTATRYDSALTRLESARVHGSPTADKLAFAKGGAFPSLAIGDGGKILVREWAAETRAAAGLTVTATLTAEAEEGG